MLLLILLYLERGRATLGVCLKVSEGNVCELKQPEWMPALHTGLPTTIVWLGGSVSLHNPIVGPDETWVSMWHK